MVRYDPLLEWFQKVNSVADQKEKQVKGLNIESLRKCAGVCIYVRVCGVSE